MKSPCSCFYSLGGWKTYFTWSCNICACSYALLGDSCSCAHLCKLLQKCNKPNHNNNKKTLTRWKKIQFVKKRHQCYTVSLKSEYKDIWAAPGPVAVTPPSSPRNMALSCCCRQRSLRILCLRISEGRCDIKVAFFLQILSTHYPKFSYQSWGAF